MFVLSACENAGAVAAAFVPIATARASEADRARYARAWHVGDKTYSTSLSDVVLSAVLCVMYVDASAACAITSLAPVSFAFLSMAWFAGGIAHLVLRNVPRGTPPPASLVRAYHRLNIAQTSFMFAYGACVCASAFAPADARVARVIGLVGVQLAASALIPYIARNFLAAALATQLPALAVQVARGHYALALAMMGALAIQQRLFGGVTLLGLATTEFINHNSYFHLAYALALPLTRAFVYDVTACATTRAFFG